MNDFCKNKFECDECSIKGICSLSPVAAAMKSVIFAFLQELAFYILKIRAFGGRNEQIKNNFIEIFSILISNSEYTQESLNSIINTIFDTLSQVKLLYQNLCNENNTSIKYYKTQVRLNKNFTFSDIIKQGQKYSRRLKQNFTDEQRRGFDVVLIILKSICLYLIELQNMGIDIDNYYMKMLTAVEMHNFEGIAQGQILEYMKKIAKTDSELVQLLCDARQEKYGKFVLTDVLISHKKGKAILVSGTDMKEMEMLLEATKDIDINIYTHGQMIIAHTLPKLKEYKHLVGHYGKGVESYMTDFSSFPGVVFLTKLSLFRVESLYRGGVFTTDKIVAGGIGKIKDYDFEPLIKSALMAEGFEETTHHESIKVGFSEQEVNKKFEELVEKIKNNKIKNVFLVSGTDISVSQKEYMDKFFSLIESNSFVLSFYPTKEKENVLFVNTDFAVPLLRDLLNLLFPLKQSFEFKINCLFTRCEPHTISNLVNLRDVNVDNIYFGTCPPTLFNPLLLEHIFDVFNIKRYTTPELDYKTMTKD